MVDYKLSPFQKIGEISSLMVFLTIILASLLCSEELLGQDTYRHVSTKDGLADNTIYHMIQDHLGYLWIATGSGVNRFDGMNFAHFTTKDGLGGNEVLKMVMDSKNRIWFLSFNGVLSYYKDGVFHNPSNTELLANIRLKASFNNLIEDRNDNIWISSEVGHLIQIHKEQVTFHEVAKSPRLNIKQIWENSSGEILLGTPSGIYKLTSDLKEIHLISNNSFWSIQSHEFPNNTRLIPFLGGILHSDEIHSIFYDNERLGIGENTIINNVLVTPYQEALIVGTLRNGLFIYENSRSPKSGIYVNWLQNKSISALLLDSEDALWVATLDDGLYRYDDGYDALGYIGAKDGLNDAIIRSSLVAKDKTVWFGGQDGSVYRFDENGSLIWKSTIDQKLDGGASIEALYESSNSEILIGAINGLFKINYELLDAALEQGLYPHVNDIIVHDENSQIRVPVIAIQGNENFIYVGSSKNLLEINLNESNNVRAIANKRITSLEIDKKGTLWVGTVDGLMFFDGTELKYSDIEITTDVLIYDIHQLYGPWLAIGTYGNGLALICTDTKTIRHISSKNGLTSDLVRSTYFDQNGILWIGTNSGLNRIELDTIKTLAEQMDHLPIVTYTASDGLKNEKIHRIEGLNNKIWMSGTNGITMLKAGYLGFSPMKIPLIVESVRINNTLTSISDTYHVPYHQNQWGIKVAGIFLRDAPRLLYKYRIGGLNDEWIITNNNFIHIEYFPPGQFQLEVETFTADGRISSDMITMSIIISPPIWQSSTLLLISIIILGLIIYSLIAKRIAWVRSEERKIIQVNKRINELELQAIQAMVKPHTIFNLLNSIRYYLVKEESDKASDLLMKFAKLIRIHLESTYKRVITLTDELERLNLFIEIESERLDQGLNFNLQIDPAIKPDNLIVPAMILHPFIENAFVHGISKAKERGELDIKIGQSEHNQLRLIISNNGPGI
jgi:ligand-binding sensor domain-containing protein